MHRRHVNYDIDLDDNIDEKIFQYNNHNTNFILSHARTPSPGRGFNGIYDNRKFYYDRNEKPEKTYYEKFERPETFEYERYERPPEIVYYERNERPDRAYHIDRLVRPEKIRHERFESPKRVYHDRFESPKRVIHERYDRLESPKRVIHERYEKPEKVYYDRLERLDRDYPEKYEKTEIERYEKPSILDRYERASSFDPEIEDALKTKWIDHSPRMARLREQRQNRLINRLQQIEQWDNEQVQKQKQFELSREQRYNSIMERLKSQDFCCDTMKRRHENEIETARELDPIYLNDHIYVETLDSDTTKYEGPLTQFRKFEAEMDNKVKALENEIDSINPKYKIEQTILPRIERTRELYSVEPEIYTSKGKRVLRRPLVDKDSKNYRASEDRDNSIFHEGVKYYYPSPLHHEELFIERTRLEIENAKNEKLKPIIHNKSVDDSSNSLSKLKLSSEKKVNFEDTNKDNKSKKSDTIDEELEAEMINKNESNGENKV